MFTDSYYKMMLLGVLLLSTSCTTFAQEVLSEEKKSLIKELLAVTNVQANIEPLVNVMIDQVEKDMPHVISQIVERDRSLTANERNKMWQDFNQASKRILGRMRVEFVKRINYAQIMDEIGHDVYAKYFTDDELRDLIAFHKSPTGQKALKIMPQIFADLHVKVRERVDPEAQAITMEIIEEEVKSIKLPKSTKPVKRRKS